MPAFEFEVIVGPRKARETRFDETGTHRVNEEMTVAPKLSSVGKPTDEAQH